MLLECSPADIEMMRRVHPGLALVFFVVVVLTLVLVAAAIRRKALWVSWLSFAVGGFAASILAAVIGIQYEDFYVECSGAMWSWASMGPYLSLIHFVASVMGMLTYGSFICLVIRAVVLAQRTGDAGSK